MPFLPPNQQRQSTEGNWETNSQQSNTNTNAANLFARHTDHRSFFQEPRLNTDADNDRVSRVEHVLRVDAELAREDREVLELVAFLEQPLLAELGEPVEEMVDDVGDKDVDADAVRHLLRLAFHLHVERHYRRVPASQRNKASAISSPPRWSGQSPSRPSQTRELMMPPDKKPRVQWLSSPALRVLQLNVEGLSGAAVASAGPYASLHLTPGR